MSLQRMLLGGSIIWGSLLLSLGFANETGKALGTFQGMIVMLGFVLFGFGVAGVAALWNENALTAGGS